MLIKTMKIVGATSMVAGLCGFVGMSNTAVATTNAASVVKGSQSSDKVITGNVKDNGKPVPGIISNGWVAESYFSNGKPFGYMNTTFKVPANPATAGNYTNFFFPGFMTGDTKELLQPVLQYGVSAGGGQANKWNLSAWHYYSSGQYATSKVVPAKPGDVIYTSMYNANCVKGSNSCDWVIYLKNNTTGQSLTFKTHSYNAITRASPNVLESYNITNCNMLPKSTMNVYNINLYDNARKVINPGSWQRKIYNNVCGVNINQSTPAKWTTIRWNGLK